MEHSTQMKGSKFFFVMTLKLQMNNLILPKPLSLPFTQNLIQYNTENKKHN